MVEGVGGIEDGVEEEVEVAITEEVGIVGEEEIVVEEVPTTDGGGMAEEETVDKEEVGLCTTEVWTGVEVAVTDGGLMVEGGVEVGGLAKTQAVLGKQRLYAVTSAKVGPHLTRSKAHVPLR